MRTIYDKTTKKLNKGEALTNRIWFLLNHAFGEGFNKIEMYDDYIVADGKYCYPYAWIENDYILYKRLCRIDN